MPHPVAKVPLSPFGVEIRNVDLSAELDEPKFQQIENAFNDAGVAVFREQNLSPEVSRAERNQTKGRSKTLPPRPSG